VHTEQVIQVELENPSQHEVELTGEILDSEGILVDGFEITDDVTNGDIEAGDGIWTGIYSPDSELFCCYSITAYDLQEDSRLSNTGRFTSVPPPKVTLDDYSLNIPSENKEY
jgi:hypothetical protein